jgi:hypothetical protein
MRHLNRMALLAAIAGLAACTDDRQDAGWVGDLQIITQGGPGVTQPGGKGGMVTIENQGAGSLYLRQAGVVPLTVNVPNAIPDLGGNPLTIAAGSIVYRTPASIPWGSGTLDDALYGDDGATAATGLHIQPGATLVINPNHDELPPAGNETAELRFRSGVYIEGTLSTAMYDAQNASRMRLHVIDLVIAPGGRIEALGGPPSGGSLYGGNGGILFIYSVGAIVNRGSIDTSGQEGPNGGQGGSVYLLSDTNAVLNAGDIMTAGGAGTGNLGGDAGSIGLNYEGLSMYGLGITANTGFLIAAGGMGAVAGGKGGGVELGNAFGSVLNSGGIATNGGNGSLSPSDGGNAGRIRVLAKNGAFRVAGTFQALGGVGWGAPSKGGMGGDIILTTMPGNIDSETCYVGANLYTAGGRADQGGAGGDVSIQHITDQSPRAGEDHLILVNYRSIDTSGGNGSSGGAAGNIEIRNSGGKTDLTGPHYTGDFANDITLKACGGNGLAAGGSGGNAAQITLANAVDDTAPKRSLANAGDLMAAGGDGALDGGSGGRVRLVDRFQVVNRARLLASGGAGGTGLGGTGGEIEIDSDDLMTNYGPIDANGGASGGTSGGIGGTIAVIGQASASYAPCSAIGGDCLTGLGGLGGLIIVTSFDFPSAVGPMSVTGGRGLDAAHNGLNGSKIVDGITVP